MKNSKIIKTLMIVTLITNSPIINAAAGDIDFGATFQHSFVDTQVSNIAYGVSSAFDSSPDGLTNTGSTALFMAVTFGESAAGSTNKLAAMGASSISIAEGFTDAFAEATDLMANAGSRSNASASVISNAFTFSPDKITGLTTSTSIFADGVSQSLALSTGNLLSLMSNQASNSNSTSDLSLRSGNDILAVHSASTLTSTLSNAFGSSANFLAAAGNNQASALANGLGSVLAITANVLELPDDFEILAGDGSANDTSVLTENFITAGGEIGLLVSSLDVLLAESIDELVLATASESSIGVGLSDTFSILLDDGRLIAGSRAGFLTINSRENILAYGSANDIFGVNSGVEVLAFGYTDAWIEKRPETAGQLVSTIPEPGVFTLLVIALMALPLAAYQPNRKKLAKNQGRTISF